KCRILIDDQSWRFDVTVQGATCLKFTTFRREDVALDTPAHVDRFRPDLALDLRMLSNREFPGRIDRAFDFAVDPPLAKEFNRPIGRNSSPEKAAGRRRRRCAVGLFRDGRWTR